jgi:thiosulfate dehydrogenase [quinone] large subunit
VIFSTMSDAVTSTPVSAPDRADSTAAFWLFRLFLGLRALLSGLEKFEATGTYSFANYYTNMNRMATAITDASFLPLWMTKLYAMSLGYLFLVLGVALLLGLKTRWTLIAMGLVYVSLGFGLMAVQESEGVAWIGVYVLMVAGALVLRRHNRFEVWADR